MDPPRRRDLGYWVEVLELTALGVVTRTLDLLWLLVRPTSMVAYLRCLVAHLHSSPYRWPRGFEAVRARSEARVLSHELVYGETPVFSAWLILRRAKLGRGERFIDLTAGRGRPMLGARLLTDRVEGFELIEERARPVVAALGAAGVNLHVGDGTRVDLSNIDVAMVTWTGFSDDLKARFESRARSLPPGARLVALDRPLDGEGFEAIDHLHALCTWGVVPVWIYRRVDRASTPG